MAFSRSSAPLCPINNMHSKIPQSVPARYLESRKRHRTASWLCILFLLGLLVTWSYFAEDFQRLPLLVQFIIPVAAMVALVVVARICKGAIEAPLSSLTCPKCMTSLLDVLRLEDLGKVNRDVAFCPFCGCDLSKEGKDITKAATRGEGVNDGGALK